MAVNDGLPAEFLLFRQHSEGLYFARRENFDLIKIIQAIYMQSLTTDVLILFNSFEPVKRVEQVISNSKSVQSAFKTSCFMQDVYPLATVDDSILLSHSDPYGNMIP